MLEMQHVTFGYGLKKSCIRDFSLTLPDGARLCLQGASGAGKTTILRLAMGLEKPRRGTVRWGAETRLSAVFQEDRLLPNKTAWENVALFSDEETAKKVLCRLGASEWLMAAPMALSGGQRRRVALARALAHPFDLLILDEALTGLDEENKALCLDAIDEAVEGKSLLMVTHDRQEAETLHAWIRGIE